MCGHGTIGLVVTLAHLGRIGPGETRICLVDLAAGEVQELTHGPHHDRLPKAAIRRTLENPTAPMPSYRGLPENKKAALVDFLSQLHGKSGG